MLQTEPDSLRIKKYPFAITATVVLLGLFLFCYILSLLSSVIVPFTFACFIAILINPLCKRLQRKIPRGLAIFCAILITLSLIAVVFYFLSTQILTFTKTLPALVAKCNMIADQMKYWINAHWGITITKQLEMVNKAIKGGEGYIGQTLNNIMSGIAVLILIPIYVFFLLFYKPLILDFIFQAFAAKHSLRVAEILGETKIAIQRYIIGLLIEMVIISVLNSTALLILGVRSAILLGVIGGILNTIPYIGGIVAILLPVLMATVTKEGYNTQLAILISYLFIQVIDNHILVPKIVSSKVKINALFSILIVLCGGLLWGYSGMFLSIPLIAILKIILDRVDGLKHWGHLLGTDIPEIHMGVKWQARWTRIFNRKKMRALEIKGDE